MGLVNLFVLDTAFVMWWWVRFLLGLVYSWAFFALSPLSCLLEALGSTNCKQKMLPIVSKTCPNCRQKSSQHITSSTVRRKLPTVSKNQLRPEGRNTRGGTRLRSPEVLAPLLGLGSRPLVSASRGLGNPLRAPQRVSEAPERLFRGLGEVCLFSTEQEKKVGHSEAPKRPRFPRMPPWGASNPRAPTLGPHFKKASSLNLQGVEIFSPPKRGAVWVFGESITFKKYHWHRK